jgi:probable FeS assembly SUF system protein SufT
MSDNEQITLKRDCEAVLIPSGERTTLGAGTAVTLSQTLGGAYTVTTGHYLARIDGKDSDALGLTPPPQPVLPDEPQLTPEGLVREDLLWRQLKTCYDPEIPVNIVELGLIYDLHIAAHPDGGSRVDVKMTLTAPGCGMGAMIAEDVQRKMLGVPGVTEAQVELVWDPPWTQAMMSEAAKLELGLM